MKIVVKPSKKLFWHFVVVDDRGVIAFTSKTYFDKPAAVEAAQVSCDFIFKGHGQIEVQDPADRQSVTSYNTREVI